MEVPKDGDYNKLFEGMAASGYNNKGKLWIKTKKGLIVWPHGKRY